MIVLPCFQLTHGQLICFHMVVNDRHSGFLQTTQKDELQVAIEQQQRLGMEGFAEEDAWLLEINLVI